MQQPLNRRRLATTVTAESEAQMDKEVISALTEHYQKTFELTYEMWKERNRLFVYLVLAAGIGLLLLLRIPQANTLLLYGVAKFLSITQQSDIEALNKAFPFDVLPSMVLVIIFYLMQRLYSTNLSVLRNYLYLGKMEDEIRAELQLTAKKVSFTREGNFYWGRRSLAQKISKWLYVIVIFIVLSPFVWMKIQRDLEAHINWVTGVDIAISALIALYIWQYAVSAKHLDVQEVPAEKNT